MQEVISVSWAGGGCESWKEASVTGTIACLAVSGEGAGSGVISVLVPWRGNHSGGCAGFLWPYNQPPHT